MPRSVVVGMACGVIGLSASALAVSPEDAFVDAVRNSQLLASELLDVEVIDARAESIGNIQDIVVDPEGGIFGVVVSVGGLLGLGTKRVALSWNEFSYAPEERAIHLGVTQKQLEQAPAFKTLAEIHSEREGARAARQADREMQGLPASSSY